MNSKTYAYLRISTKKQEINSQRYGILDYANKKRLGTLNFVEDSSSGRVHWRRRKLGQLLDELEPNSLIIFSEVSRIGRTILQILEFLEEATKKGVIIHAAKENLLIDTSLQSKVLVTIFGLVADIERGLLSARTKEGIAAAREQGAILGRPKGSSTGKLKLDAHHEVILSHLQKGVTQSNIAKIVGCDRNTLSNWIKVRVKENEHIC